MKLLFKEAVAKKWENLIQPLHQSFNEESMLKEAILSENREGLRRLEESLALQAINNHFCPGRGGGRGGGKESY